MKLLTRVLTSLIIAAVVIPAYFVKDGIYFYWVLRFGFLMAIIETLAVITESWFLPIRIEEYGITTLVFVELCISLIGIGGLSIDLLGGSVVVCVCTDAFAYLIGTLIGGKLIKKRPFPVTSPSKSFEGLIAGLLFGVVAAYLWANFSPRSSAEAIPFWRLVLVAPVSVAGDLLESRFKRLYSVKDANDYVLKTPVLRWIEKPLGGRNGHGGYFDRLDSLALVLALQLLVP